jgi:phosphoribosylamine--glycine ligase
MTIKILLLGSGGREHALATALEQDPFTEALYCAPGNPGIAQIAQIFPLDISDPVAVLALSQKLSIDLVVIGPELPLIHGVADALVDPVDQSRNTEQCPHDVPPRTSITHPR